MCALLKIAVDFRNIPEYSSGLQRQVFIPPCFVWHYHTRAWSQCALRNLGALVDNAAAIAAGGAIPTLIALLSLRSVDVPEGAARALFSMGTHHDVRALITAAAAGGAVSALEALLVSPTEEVRDAAAGDAAVATVAVGTTPSAAGSAPAADGRDVVCSATCGPVVDDVSGRRVA